MGGVTYVCYNDVTFIFFDVECSTLVQPHKFKVKFDFSLLVLACPINWFYPTYALRKEWVIMYKIQV